MEEMYEAVIFDLDGTLIDSLDDIRISCNETLAEFNLPSRAREEIRRFVGNGAKRLVEQIIPAEKLADKDFFEKVYTRYLEIIILRAWKIQGLIMV